MIMTTNNADSGKDVILRMMIMMMMVMIMMTVPSYESYLFMRVVKEFWETVK